MRLDNLCQPLELCVVVGRNLLAKDGVHVSSVVQFLFLYIFFLYILSLLTPVYVRRGAKVAQEWHESGALIPHVAELNYCVFQSVR